VELFFLCSSKVRNIHYTHFQTLLTLGNHKKETLAYLLDQLHKSLWFRRDEKNYHRKEGRKCLDCTEDIWEQNVREGIRTEKEEPTL
jgi:hypothetical protein